MNRNILIIGGVLFCSFFTLSVSGQDIDSLWANFQKAGERERAAAANELLGKLEEQRYAADVLEFTDEAPDAEIEIETTTWMANRAFLKERYHETIELMGRVEELSLATGDSARLQSACYLTGFAWQRLGYVDKALEYSTRSYELCKAMGDEEKLSSVINNIANIYQTNDQDSIAIGFYRESIAIERRLGRNQQLATRLGNLSNSLMKLGRLDEALKTVMEALTLDRAGTRPDKIAARLNQMAEVYKAMKRYSEAEACLTEATDYFEKAGSLYGMASSLNILGDISQLRGSFDRADEYFNRAADYAARNGNRHVYQKIAKNIWQLNRERDPAKALKYYEESVAIKDSIFGVETQQQIGEFQVKYDVQGKELEIVRQQAEIDRRETLGWMLGGGLAAAGGLLALLGYALVLRTRQRRTLAEANATKDSFFSIISHDLKNPAIAQRDALQMLANHSGQWDADSLATYYRELLKSADGQVELLYNLLNWAQVQTGRMPYRPVRFDLAAALRPDIDLVRSMADRKGVAFEAAIPETALVTGDSSMIATVVRNLLTNAVKFTPSGGNVSLRVEAAAGGWRIAVRDTGVGMSAEQIRDLFRIDTRRSLAGTAGEQGSGLGLIVCRELLEKHGTHLDIESEEGKGSEFRFTLHERDN